MDEPRWRILLSLSTSSLVVSALIATTSAKHLLGVTSPKRIQQLAHIVNIASVLIIALGTGIAGSYEAFIVGRFASGYPLGVNYGEFRFGD